MSSRQSPYDVLGVSRFCSTADIKRNYRTLSVENHPDKSNDAGATFRRVNEAYEVLMNKGYRQVYDAHVPFEGVEAAWAQVRLRQHEDVQQRRDEDEEEYLNQHPEEAVQQYEETQADMHQRDYKAWERFTKEEYQAFQRAQEEHQTRQAELRKEEEKRQDEFRKQANMKAHEEFKEKEQEQKAAKAAAQEASRSEKALKKQHHRGVKQQQLDNDKEKKSAMKKQAEHETFQKELADKMDELAGVSSEIPRLQRKLDDFEKLQQKKSSTLTPQQKQKLKEGKACKLNLQKSKEKLELLENDISSLATKKLLISASLQPAPARFEVVRAWDGLTYGADYLQLEVGDALLGPLVVEDGWLEAMHPRTGRRGWFPPASAS